MGRLARFRRLWLSSVGGWVAIHWLGGGLAALSTVMALALVTFGVTLAAAVTGGAWSRDH